MSPSDINEYGLKRDYNQEQGVAFPLKEQLKKYIFKPHHLVEE